MCKVILTNEDDVVKSYIVAEETVLEILKHFRVNLDTKTVYLNGKELSREKMNKKVPQTGTVHISVKNKTI